ncbi:2OG-Fe(II) oxygenase [Streptomyces sp. NPDC029006]|uniref:2OG-Fe(II) oxygenase n=1 Tax=Streptomyces sp. NPDC029006 TaxID=3155467 RepID=UPI0033FCA00D
MRFASHLASPFSALASSHVVEAEHVTGADLVALAKGEVMAISVDRYCDPELGREIAERLLSDEHRYTEYENVPDVHKWGLNTYEGLSSREHEEHYFADALPAIQSLREYWAPNISPIDRLRLELQEGWPGGANMEYLDGQPLFVGQARIFHEGKGAIPHQDFLPWELRDRQHAQGVDNFAELIGQLTANMYLITPESGGELELWPAGYDYPAYDLLRSDPSSYGLDRGRIPEATTTLKPHDGLLILFHATRVHAVRPSQGSDRVALSTFIGVRGTDKPLTYWS